MLQPFLRVGDLLQHLETSVEAICTCDLLLLFEGWRFWRRSQTLKKQTFFWDTLSVSRFTWPGSTWSSCTFYPSPSWRFSTFWSTGRSSLFEVSIGSLQGNPTSHGDTNLPLQKPKKGNWLELFSFYFQETKYLVRIWKFHLKSDFRMIKVIVFISCFMQIMWIWIPFHMIFYLESPRVTK